MMTVSAASQTAFLVMRETDKLKSSSPTRTHTLIQGRFFSNVVQSYLKISNFVLKRFESWGVPVKNAVLRCYCSLNHIGGKQLFSDPQKKKLQQLQTSPGFRKHYKYLTF